MNVKKVKVHVVYTIETDYEFDRDEFARWADPTEDFIENIHGWIEEDFNKVETRADNVLPQYHSSLTFTTEEINEWEIK